MTYLTVKSTTCRSRVTNCPRRIPAISPAYGQFRLVWRWSGRCLLSCEIAGGQNAEPVEGEKGDKQCKGTSS